ncbi:polyprotein [Phytophthora megakarya]|uniref:Polyprotein n=1 Tax=Phytophthora megakarya TaxID=4795 RepID=A0A225WGC8_9STRA|nr:polyprotein [Phytophthora megakarya]
MWLSKRRFHPMMSLVQTSMTPRARGGGSKRIKRRRSRRYLQPCSNSNVSVAPVTESINAIEYVNDAAHRSLVLEVANPPPDAEKHFLRDFIAGEIEQVCLITASAAVISQGINSVDVSEDKASCPKSGEPKLAREERFETQSWEALRESGNPVYETAREFADVFHHKIPSELPADPGVSCCRVIKSTPSMISLRVAVKLGTSVRASRLTGVREKGHNGWRIVHAFNKLNDATISA